MQKTGLLFFLILLQVNLLVPMEDKNNLKRKSTDQIQQNVKKFCLEQSGNNYFKNVPVEIVKKIVSFCFNQKNGLKENVNTLLMIPLVCKQFQKAVEDYKDVRDFFVNKRLKLPLTEQSFMRKNKVFFLTKRKHEAVFDFNFRYSNKDDFIIINKNDFKSMFFEAIKKGKITLITLFVKKGAEVNKSFFSVFPLSYAVKYGKKEVVKFLLNEGASINDFSFAEKYSDGITPIAQACLSRHKEIVKLLIDHKADVNLSDTIKCALERKLIGENKKNYQKEIQEIISILINNGAKVQSLDTLSELMKMGYRFSYILKNLNTKELNDLFCSYLLFESIELQRVKQFLSHGVECNYTYSEYGATPLLLVFQSYYTSVDTCIAVIQFLLKKGADINLQNLKGQSLVSYYYSYDRNLLLFLLKQSDLKLMEKDIEILNEKFANDQDVIELINKKLQKQKK